MVAGSCKRSGGDPLLQKRLWTTALAIAITTVLLPGVLASHTAAPAGPVTNGEFEAGAADRAVSWTRFGGTTTDASARFADVDGDLDREAVVPADPDVENRNFFQNVLSGPTRSHAFSANFHALEFEVEGAALPSGQGARVHVSVSTDPAHSQEARPYALLRDCVLKIPVGGQSGSVSLSPVEGGADLVPVQGLDIFDFECADLTQSWDDASREERRRILGRLTVTGIGFWDLNQGTQPAVVDDVRLEGASLVAEEVADGNFERNPRILPE